MLHALLIAAEIVVMFPGFICFLLVVLPGVQLTLPGMLLYSFLLGTLYSGLSYLWTPALNRVVPRGILIDSDQISVYFIALMATVAAMCGFRNISWLRSGREFSKRSGSAFLVGLLVFAVTAISAFPAALMLQWFVDHIMHVANDNVGILGVYAMWPLLLWAVFRRNEHFRLQQQIAGVVGWLFSFPLAFYLYFMVQFATKFTF